jgi:hypothetical protein
MRYLTTLFFLLLAMSVFSQSTSDIIKTGKKPSKTNVTAGTGVPTNPEPFALKEETSIRIVLYALPQSDTIKVVNPVYLEVKVIESFYDVTSPTGEKGKLPSTIPVKVFFADETNKTIQLDEKRILALYPCNYCK